MGTTLRLRLRYVPIQYKTNSKKMIIFETKFNLHYTLLGILPNLPQIFSYIVGYSGDADPLSGDTDPFFGLLF